MTDKINVYNILIVKLEGNRSFGRHVRRQEHSFKWILMEYSQRVWIELIWLERGLWAHVNAVMNFQVPYNIRNVLTG
jgi:hypothetical protein